MDRWEKLPNEAGGPTFDVRRGDVSQSEQALNKSLSVQRGEASVNDHSKGVRILQNDLIRAGWGEWGG